MSGSQVENNFIHPRGENRDLPSLLQDLEITVSGTLPQWISGITHVPEHCGPNDLFVAFSGPLEDLHSRIPSCAAVLVEHPTQTPPGVCMMHAPGNMRRTAGILCARFWGHPSRRQDVVGVTGTNGKTTTVAMTESVLRAGGHRVAVTGSLGMRIGSRHWRNKRNTPEIPTWQAFLEAARTSGCRAVLSEFASGGLERLQVDPINLAVGAYTSLGRDHLDQHGGMAAYQAAKARLFTELLDSRSHAVLWAEDPRCCQVDTRARVLRFGWGAACDIHPERLECRSSGSHGVLQTPAGRIPFELPAPGRHNVANALCAAGIALALECGSDAISEGLAAFVGAAGRLEPVANVADLQIYVDYAHTPDALETVLRSLREIHGGRLLLVFGCAGNRDKSKRPEMGQIASDLSDRVFATSDNPRWEDPHAILEGIAEGLGENAVIISDRANAIHQAVAAALPGDVVLIAGKGHERNQEVRGRYLPFDDRQVAAESVAAVASKLNGRI